VTAEKMDQVVMNFFEKNFKDDFKTVLDEKKKKQENLLKIL